MTDPVGALPALRYLDAATVERHLPDAEEAISLAGLVLDRVGRPGGSAPKVSLPPIALGVFAQAMPARIGATDSALGRALLGMKWISGGASNRARGLPLLGSVIVLNDPDTGAPIAIMDGSSITAVRTAALSGAAIGLLTRYRSAMTALMIGAGAQGRAHMPILRACGVTTVWIHDRHPDRADALAAHASGLGMTAKTVAEPRKALHEADIVVSATALGGSEPWIGSGDVAPDAVVVPVDYAAQVTAELVQATTTFAVDDVAVFRENRERGRLLDWPDPGAALAELADRRGAERWERPPGIAVALHQGPGLADVVFADAALRSAIAAGEGLELPR